MPFVAEAKAEAEARLRHGLVGQSFSGGRWLGTPIVELNSRYSLLIESSWHYFDAASSIAPIDLWEKASIPPVEDLMFLACKLRYANIIAASLGETVANLLLTFDTGEHLAIFGNDPLYECWSMNDYTEGKEPDYSVYNLPRGDVSYLLFS